MDINSQTDQEPGLDDLKYKCSTCRAMWIGQLLADICCVKQQTSESESVFVQDFKEYMETVKTNHYSGGKVQVIDLVEGLGMLEAFAVSNAIKYMARYPKTRNKKDLLKSVHYISMVYKNGV